MRSKTLVVLLAIVVLVAPASADLFSDIGGVFSSIFKFPFAAAGCGGFTTLGATPFQMSSNDENLSGKYTQITTVANCGGESLDFIQRDQLSSFLNLPVGTDIGIGLKETTEINSYPIFNEAVPVYTYVSSEFDSRAAAKPTPGWTYVWHTSCWNDVYLYREQIGLIGSIGAPSSNAAALLTVTAGNKTSTAKIGTLQLGATLETADGDEIGSATWLGSLVTGQALPSESNYAAFYDLGQKSWRVTTAADKLAYISKQAAADAAILSVPMGQAWVGGSGSGWASYCYGAIFSPSGAISATSISSSAASELMSSTAQLGTAPIGNAAQLDGATIPFAVVGKINNPFISLRIRADLLNIVLSVGRPQIASVSSPKFGVGEFGELKATVQNVGTAQGSFSLSATCSGLDVQPSQAVTIPMGGSAELKTILAGKTAQKGTCDVKVCDLNGRECSTATANFEVTPTKICIPGEIKPDIVLEAKQIFTGASGEAIESPTGLALYQCAADGMSLVPLVACDVGSLVYEPDAKPYGWACTELKKCGAPETIIETYKSTYSPTTTTAVTYSGPLGGSEGAPGTATPLAGSKPITFTFTAGNACSYMCNILYGNGELNPPTGETASLIGCNPAKVAAAVTTLRQTKVLSPPVLTPPPIKNASGAGTAGICKVDDDCLYVGEGCVTGQCAKKGGIAGLPGFEAVFAVAGLLAVAYWMRRRTGG